MGTERIETQQDWVAFLSGVYEESRAFPERTFTMTLQGFRDMADTFYSAGLGKGLSEPVPVKVRDVTRDGKGNIERIVEYRGVAPRPES